MEECRLCPRRCGANRVGGEAGFCGAASEIRIARAALHFWEEPCISGREGSGTVFFSGCALRCVYCQNHAISHENFGKPVSCEELANLFLSLERQGANNINLVTPDHFIPDLVPVMRAARGRGLSVPFVVNCSGYETAGLISRLDGLADIYLTDFKYMDPEKAAKYSGAGDYPERAKESLEEMHRQVPEAVFDSRGIMKKGIIVRHLLLPGMVREAEKIISYVFDAYGDSVFLSLLRQYTPFKRASERFPELGRRVTKREYERMVDFAIGLGVNNAFLQEAGTADASFVPDWDMGA